VALPGHLALSSVLNLPQRLLPQATAMRPLLCLLLRTELLLRKALAVYGAILQFRLQRLLLQAAPGIFAMLHPAQ
jgi:hypothetical protein